MLFPHIIFKGTLVPVYDKITPGPTGVGTRYREAVQIMPFVTGEILTEVVGYEPDRRLAYRYVALGMAGELAYSFEPVGGGTRLVQQQSLRPDGVLGLSYSLWRKKVSMTTSPMERKIRAGLPIVRFMQEHIPLSLSHFLLKQSLAHTQLGAGVMRQAVSADSVPCEWIIPQNCRAERVLLYLHGGGFVFGLTPPHLHMAAYLAQNLGMRILMVDYRLAPQHPFPAALEDCETAYRWLLKQGILARNMLVAGDSAGGNLTLTLLMKLRDSGSPLPAAAACLSPVTDLTDKENLGKGFKDPLLPAKAIEFYTQSYVGQSDAHEPLISPVYGDLRGLSPLLVHVGEDEILRDDAVRIVNLAKIAGVEAWLQIYPRMWHVWQLNLSLPQATQSLEHIVQFFKAHLELVEHHDPL